MSIGNYFENAILYKMFRNVDFQVTGVYVSLHDGAAGETGANEISATGAYIRQGATFSTGTAAGSVDNVSAINFTSMMPSGTITDVGAWDAQAGGNFMMGGTLTASKNVNEGDTFTIGAGDLDFSLD